MVDYVRNVHSISSLVYATKLCDENFRVCIADSLVIKSIDLSNEDWKYSQSDRSLSSDRFPSLS